MNRNRSFPSFKSLTAFEAVVRLGSMTAAARELDTTQPAISQRIRALEDSIGPPLFDRSGGRITVTGHGRELYDEVSAALSRIDRTVRRLQTSTNSPQRHRVTIAAYFGFTHLWLLPRLAILEEAFPQIQFEIAPVEKADDRKMALADLSVRFGRFDCVDGSEQMLECEEVFPVCSPEFASRYRLDNLRDVDLNQVPLLHLDTRDARWLDWEQWCRMTDITASTQPPKIRYNNYPLMLNAVAEGSGLALGWSTLVRQSVQEGRLIALAPFVRRSNFGYILRSRYQDNAIVEPIKLWLLKHVTACLPTWRQR